MRFGQFAPRRRGVSIVYISAVMLVLLGFCSFAVDVARVQTAKTELERATDAAARAAALALSQSSSISAIQSAAYSVANANKADGNPVVIDSVNNVVFLNWPSTTPLTGSARSSANAIQVSAGYQVPTLFAMALGRSAATIHATSIARYTPAAAAYQIVGLNSIAFNSSCYSDSYNSSLGSYASQTPGSQGSIASNGTIDVYSGSTINGNVYYSGSTPTISTVGGTCTGLVTGVSSISVATPTMPGGATSKGNINITGSSQNMTLTSGNYSCAGITLDSGGTLTINASSGPVNLYCSGAVAGNGGNIAVTNNIPNNFHLYITNSSSVQLNSGSYWYVVLDAPLSNVSLTANAALYGSVVANNLTVDSGTAIHFDQALGANGGSGGSQATITQVQ
jgi:Flp pilus assembly protein TadG